MNKYLKFIKPYILPLILLVGFVFVSAMTDLELPDYMAKIVNEGIVTKNQDLIFDTGLKMLGVALIGAVCTIIAGYFAAKISTGISRDLRKEIFIKVEGFSLTEFNKFPTASLITRSTNDIQQVQTVLFMTLRMLISAPILGIGAIIKAYQGAPSMTWIVALDVIILMSIIITIFIIAIPRFTLLQKLVDKLNLVTRENLTGIRVIRAFNAEEYEKQKFEKVNQDLTSVTIFVNRIMVVMQPLMMFIFNVTLITITWVGAHQINSGKLMIGDMMAFMQYAMQVLMSFLMISIMFIIIPRASVSLKRISEVLRTKAQIRDPQNPVEQKIKEVGTIEFKNVTFKYPNADTPVLQNITFTANPNETTAFVGSTGSGKSTLINLIPRFYDVTEGQVLIDGIDVRDMKQEDLHSKIGYVPQKGILFSGTIASNIKYGKPNANDSEVKEASNISQSQEFVEKLEQKYNSPIEQGGTNVSGGQKQRLAIARALMMNPEIYIFDDSFSALDFKTDAKLRKALDEKIGKATILIVAQRISTIMDADKIIVIDEGKIVGIGTHDELMKTCNVYKEIALSQMSEKEASL